MPLPQVKASQYWDKNGFIRSVGNCVYWVNRFMWEVVDSLLCNDCVEKFCLLISKQYVACYMLGEFWYVACYMLGQFACVRVCTTLSCVGGRDKFMNIKFTRPITEILKSTHIACSFCFYFRLVTSIHLELKWRNSWPMMKRVRYSTVLRWQDYGTERV